MKPTSFNRTPKPQAAPPQLLPRPIPAHAALQVVLKPRHGVHSLTEALLHTQSASSVELGPHGGFVLLKTRARGSFRRFSHLIVETPLVQRRHTVTPQLIRVISDEVFD